MEAVKILRESFKILLEEPLLFTPKILSTLLSSLVIIFLLAGRGIFLEMNPLILLMVMLFLPLTVATVGVIASVTVAAMVKHHGEGNFLKKSFSEVTQSLDQAFKAGLFFMLAGSILGVITLVGFSLYLETGNLPLLISSALFALITILGFSYISYFLPATLLEFGSLRKSFHNSFTTSNENSKLVTFMVIFSFILLGLALLSSGKMEKLGYTGFVAGRLVSSVVNTYVFVVSPNLYYSSSESLD